MGRRPLRPQGARPASKCDICEKARTKKCTKARSRRPIKKCDKFVPVWDDEVT